MNFKRISASCFCLLLAGNIAVSAQTVTLGSNKVSLKAAFEKIEKASKYKIASTPRLLTLTVWSPSAKLKVTCWRYSTCC